MTKKQILETIKSARVWLAKHYVPWTREDANGDGCQLGALHHAMGRPTCRYEANLIVDRFEKDHIAPVARRMHPELTGQKRPRLPGGFYTLDDFEYSPAVFVNNQLGKEAILAVYEEAIAQYEVAALCDEVQQASEVQAEELLVAVLK